MQRHPEYTRQRLAQLAGRMRELIYPQSRQIDKLMIAPAADRISFPEAQHLSGFAPAQPGQSLGPDWATWWLRAEATVPPEWAGKPVHLYFIAHNCEATLWVDGDSRQGLNWNFGRRPNAVLKKQPQAGEKLEFQIEIACNHKFGVGDKRTPFANVNPFVLDRCDIALFDEQAWKLYFDFLVLQELEAEIAREGGTAEKTFAGELLHELNAFANAFDLDDRSTWAGASAILDKLYLRVNGSQMHEMSAIGHAHIDTAWLWPLAET
jgi:alpha-mannosidase